MRVETSKLKAEKRNYEYAGKVAEVKKIVSQKAAQFVVIHHSLSDNIEVSCMRKQI